jgi:hypothetical protein
VATAEEQLAAAQTVDTPGGSPHLVRSEPLHCALHAPVPTHAVRVPRGAPLTAMHVPTLPATLHASHCPVHSVSQHTPSAHFPVGQLAAVAAVHAAPYGNLQSPTEPGMLHF